ncbi:MAG: lipopolysaccharide biosynthesis protein, partial [Myxococcota bacterium]|nr:lipopolysaccharide biosynthesis protein [Myxococcota bacterium]
MSLARRALSGSVWAIVQIGGQRAFGSIVFIVLARLVSPEEIGIASLASALVMVIVGFLSGFPGAVVQRETLTEAEADTAFWANLLIGLLLTLLSLAGAPWLAAAFEIPELSPVLRVLSLSVAFNALGSIHQARLRREFGFRTLAIRALVSTLLSGTAGIVLAVRGYGVWSLVVYFVATELGLTALAWLGYRWLPRVRFDTRSFREMLGFTSNLTGTHVLAVVNTRFIDIAIGFFLGAAATGYFRVARQLFDLVTQICLTPLQTNALPIFSRMQQDRARLAIAFEDLVRATAHLTFPAFLGLAAVLPVLIPLVFGERWEPSIVPGQVLCLIVAMYTLVFFAPMVLSSVGRADQALRVSFAQTSANVVAVLIGVNFGLVGVVAAYVIRAHLVAPYTLYVLH